MDVDSPNQPLLVKDLNFVQLLIVDAQFDLMDRL